MGKTLYKLVVVTLYMLVTTSCSDNSFLNETQTTDLDQKTVFADSTYTAGFLSNIYTDIGFDVNITRFTVWGNGGGLQTSCDESEFKVSSSSMTDAMFATGTVNAITVTDDAWSKCYSKIRACNVFLKNVDGSPMTEAAKLTYKAEARFLRAWYYFILLRHYGGIPLLYDEVYKSPEDVKMTRDTFGECVDYICKECEDAAKVLPTRRTGRDNGRISAGICYSLISRIKLYAASKLYNGSDFAPAGYNKELVGYKEYDKERWKDAVDAAKRVIALQAYKLYSRHKDDTGKDEKGWGYYAQFLASDYYSLTEYNGETFPSGAYSGVIFTQNRDNGVTPHQALTPPSCGGGGYGGYPYEELVESYPMIDGKPIGESRYTYDDLNQTKNRDPRFGLTIVTNGTVLKSAGDDNHIVYTYTGSGATQDGMYTGTQTGYYSRKFCHRACAGNWWVMPPQDIMLIRYSEILLNYAEAVNEYYGPDYTESFGGSEMSPYTVLKAIRERAGIEAGEDGMYGLKANMTYEEMRDAIRLERRIEFAFEGHRFFDVRRWMIANETENRMLHGFEITRSTTGTLSRKVVSVRQHVFRPAMYFFPIPYSETSKSNDLIQNPYYE